MMKKILIIEDSESIGKSLEELMQLNGFVTEVASNGKEGIEMAAAFMPHLIICDIMMPEMNGHEVLEAVRKNPDLSNTPFIFLTAKATSKDLREGMNLGADDYLTKPFKAKNLFRAVEARLERHRKNKEEVLRKTEELIHFVNNAHDDIY